jgi:hypothetical protein
VLLQPHSAPLGLAFNEGNQFPAEWKGDAFVALHGSWNRELHTGYKIVRLPFKDGKLTGEYQAVRQWSPGSRALLGGLDGLGAQWVPPCAHAWQRRRSVGLGRAGRIQNQCANFLRARRPLAAAVGEDSSVRRLAAGDDALARRRHVRAASGGGAWQSG